jgi:hypothetical protein
MDNCELALKLGWKHVGDRYELTAICRRCGGECRVKYSLTSTEVFSLQPGLLENVTVNKNDELWEHIRAKCPKHMEGD